VRLGNVDINKTADTFRSPTWFRSECVLEGNKFGLADLIVSPIFGNVGSRVNSLQMRLKVVLPHCIRCSWTERTHYRHVSAWAGTGRLRKSFQRELDLVIVLAA
jgi:glutathione S-transferase